MNERKKYYISFKSIFITTILLVILFLNGCQEKKPEESNTANVFMTKNEITVTSESESIAPSSEKANEIIEPNLSNVGDNVPISRAIVAKMLAFLDNTKSEIDFLPRTIKFSDMSENVWYDRYVNSVVNSNYMSGAGDVFNPNKPLTLSHAQSLLDRLDKTKFSQIKLTTENRDKAISYALWVDLYYKTIEKIAELENKTVEEKYGITTKNLIVLATTDNNKKLSEWNMITNKGLFTYSGLFMGDYIDKEITVLVKDNEIIAFLGVLDYAPTIKSAYIVDKTDNQLTIFSGGAERSYSYNSTELENNISIGDIADIKINGTKIEKVFVYTDSISGKIKKADGNKIELEKHGEINLSNDYSIYSVVDGIPKYKSISSLTMGSDIAKYYIYNDEIVGIIINKTTLPNNIRIVLNTTDFESLIHEKVSLTSDKDFTVSYGDVTKKFKGGQIFSIDQKDLSIFENATRIYVKPDNKNDKIQFTSFMRNKENPSYRGQIEISQDPKGFIIVNELGMDEYLYAVVPSEMPTSHGLEAAKVQAITARSYAYNQYYSNRFYKYGANIDDSVSSQVYNNTPENANSIEAVNSTTGMCLTYKGTVISANYFSTSSGSTAKSGEVWANSATGEFPVFTPEYLQNVKQYTVGDYGDLSKEENAATFYKTIDITGYDNDFPWFRWNVSMSNKQLTDTINANISNRYLANPKLIKTLDENGKFISQPIESIGDLIDIEVLKRGAGGNIMELKITGTKNTVIIQTEYNIRTILEPAKIGDTDNIFINKKDGTTNANYKLLPSAFFYMEKTKDTDGNLTSITFYGGGNGHGAGMSQNGVKGMIDKGFSFDEILKHYYSNTEVKKMIK